MPWILHVCPEYKRSAHAWKKEKKKEWCWGVSWKKARTVKWKQRANQKGREKSKGNSMREKDRAERSEQKTQTISEIYFYILQTYADHHPRDWKQFCRCSLGPRPCWRAVYLKGLIGSVVSHGDSSVWGWESERPSWITDYSKACADLTQPPRQSS